MNKTSPLKVTILDKEYLITCEEEEVDSLHNAIDYLNNKMAETKKNGSVIGSERIAVMTALNIANEMLEHKRENQDYAFKIDSTLSRLQTKINDALDKGVEEVFIGIGGSSTNDLGLGIFAALGVIFLDKNNNEIMPNGSNLVEIEKLIILDSLRNKIKRVKWFIVNDVENILFGENGAANTYAEQKGANKNDIEKLESGGNSVHQVLSEFFKKDYSKIKGAGAAGGCGYGLKLLTEGEFINGIDILFKIININKVLDGGANYIITGEGQIDHQTLSGKAVYSLTRRLKPFNIPILVICGKNLLKKNEWESLGVENVLTLSEKGHSDKYCMENAKELVEELINDYLKAKNT